MDGEISARYVCNPCLVKEIDNSQHCEKQKSRPLLKTDLESLLYCSFSSVLLLPSPACLLSVFNFAQPAVPIPKKVFFPQIPRREKNLALLCNFICGWQWRWKNLNAFKYTGAIIGKQIAHFGAAALELPSFAARPRPPQLQAGTTPLNCIFM